MVKHVTMPLKDLVPAPYNPRRISKAAMAGLRHSLQRFGLVQPIVWNQRTKHVVGGHQRIEALRANGETKADVIVVDLPEIEEKALNVTLNNAKISGEYTDSLEGLLHEIDEADAGMMRELRLDALLPPEEPIDDTYATRFGFCYRRSPSPCSVQDGPGLSRTRPNLGRPRSVELALLTILGGSAHERISPRSDRYPRSRSGGSHGPIRRERRDRDGQGRRCERACGRDLLRREAPDRSGG